MTNSSNKVDSGQWTVDSEKQKPLLTKRRFAAHYSLLLIPVLYFFTVLHGLILGDPTEYTVVSHLLGIAHPPGYAVMTLLGKLSQSLNPFGDIPWRMHWQSSLVATLSAVLLYGAVRSLSGKNALAGAVAGLFGAFTLATISDQWLHAIHANPHILTAAFLAGDLFCLTRWGAETDNPRWLLRFSFLAGLGVGHHPLTVFAFPAYTLFIIWQRPSVLKDWRLLLKMVLCALLGLTVLLYFPLRSGPELAFGSQTMNTLDGFLAHVLARGLAESLPYFSLADQPIRTLVFWSLLRLQYTIPTLLLALWGGVWLAQDKAKRPFLALYLFAFLGNYAFVVSLKAQDILAYLLGPFWVIALFAGMGLLGLWERWRWDRRGLLAATAVFFLAGPVWQTATNWPRIAPLHTDDEGGAYIASVFSQFEGKGEGAILLNDWEHMTPLWYAQFVQEHWPDPADVTPVLVSTDLPWLESVLQYLPGHPVYLSNYRREVVDFGFRLRPVGTFYQVIDTAQRTEFPQGVTAVTPVAAGDIEFLGYALPQTEVMAGAYVPLTLALRTAVGTADYYVPVVHVGDISYPFTTDSHLVSPAWQAGEIIAERFDLSLPLTLASGTYPVSLDFKNLSQDTDIPSHISLGELHVTALSHTPQTDDLLANFRQRLGLVKAGVWGNGRWAQAPWGQPISVEAGQTVDVVLRWRGLALAEESYTVFVHLITPANQPLVALDYTPLGGALPTHLWLPKWLPGQEADDPYRLTIPPDTPPGTYAIEVGLYEMVSKRRLHIADAQGNLVGDRFILGNIEVK